MSRRAEANQRLVVVMRQIHLVARQTYGSPRMQAELKYQGYSCGHNRVARLMRQEGLIAKMTVRFRSLTKAGKREPAAENVLNRQFTVAEPNRVWAADITYVPTAEGHLYLAIILDLHSRQVVGWAMTSRLGSELVSLALGQAMQRRLTTPGLVHHSDRDGLYACDAYKQIQADNQMIRSMSRKGNCYDNACVESFFSSLKNELVAFERFRSRAEAQLKIFEWIEVFYNRFRRHSTLGYLSPVDFEKQIC
jgi:transposase InsO family protein